MAALMVLYARRTSTGQRSGRFHPTTESANQISDVPMNKEVRRVPLWTATVSRCA